MTGLHRFPSMTARLAEFSFFVSPDVMAAMCLPH
jgi:hypothetical protein